ncbi:MAG TPA: helical backbone metal receptor [Gemmatimonadales bacterium]|nr:helical backbone metal receptor [Gemmatimonadales bacterium]
MFPTLGRPRHFRAAALRIAVAAVAVAAVALGACRAEPARSGRSVAAPIRVVDDMGDTVALAQPATRLVSLIPASTELLFALGAGPRVVGRSHWCDYPAAATAVADVGDGINPSLEAILARRPDLVLLYASGQNVAAARRLRALGVPAFLARTDRIEDVARLARVFGTLTGRAAAADSLVAAFADSLRAATGPDTLPAARRPSVFLLVWDQPPMTVGAGSFLSELMERAGGRNVFADLRGSSAEISVEAVATRNPDLVLTGGADIPRIATLPAWQGIPAVRERRFVRIPGSEFNRPGPRTPQAIRELRARMREALARTPARTAARAAATAAATASVVEHAAR